MLKKHTLLALYFIALLATSPLIAQTTVPPVKKQSGGSGSMTVNPNPNQQGTQAGTTSSGQQSSGNTATPQPVSAGGQNAITVIVDYSGSMSGAPLSAAKKSTAILIDLIDLWGSQLFPQQIGNINFQYVEFGGTGESTVLYPLGTITNSSQLKTDILQSTTSYGGTDFSSGFDAALGELSGKNLQNKTLFLTDAGDGGAGPNSSPGYYDPLNDVNFLIYNSPGSSVQQKGWLNAVQNGNENHVDSEYDVTSIFVKTLFGFVDNINRFLVRQGKKSIDVGQPNFEIIKHNPDKEHLLILSRPLQSLKIEKILDANGQEVPAGQYTIYEAASFFNVVLSDSLPKGAYQIVFDQSTFNRSYYISYINFEETDIFLKAETTPQLSQGECFVENSAVVLDFKYWDRRADVAVDYPDFLSHVAYQYDIRNGIGNQSGLGDQGLVFNYTFPYGSSSKYEIWTAWNYNLGKLQNGDPPLGITQNICVTQNGSLVHLEYDTALTWEGRQIEMTATVLDQSNPNLTSTNQRLYLSTGTGQTVTLKQDIANQFQYTGLLDYVKGETQYKLSMDNRNANFQFALDSSSQASFYGKGRKLKVTYTGKDFSSIQQKVSFNDFFDKMRFAFNNQSVPVNSFSYTGQNIVIPYQIPFYDPVNETIGLTISINKIFPDEHGMLKLVVDSLAHSYPAKDVKSGGIWGWFSSSNDYPDAVKFVFNFPDSIPLSSTSLQSSQQCNIIKREGQMYFDQPLYKEPQFETQGALTFTTLQNQTRNIPLQVTEVKFDITTSFWDRFRVQTIWWFYRVLFGIILFVIIILYLLPYLVAKKKNNQKVRFWKRVRDTETLLLKDLWRDPVNGEQCNSVLELPEQLKSKFLDSHGQPSKAALLSWHESLKTIQNKDKESKEIKRKIAYKSMIRKTNVFGKFVYVLFLPFSVLIDLWRNAMEWDDSIIKNKDFLKYVRTIEDLNVPNVPSEWYFAEKSQIHITFADKKENAARTRHLRLQGNIAELQFHSDKVVLIAGKQLEVKWPDGEREFLMDMGRCESPKFIDSFYFIVNEQIEVRVENINYEAPSCNIKTHLYAM